MYTLLNCDYVQLEKATDVVQLRQAAGSNRCLLVDAGFTQSAHHIDLSMKPAIIKALSLHHLLHSKAELDQFRDGLDCLRVLDCIKAKPDLMKVYFISPTVSLTAGD